MQLNIFITSICFTIITNAQGGLTSPRTPKKTHSPNDVLAPPVQVIHAPPKSSSSKTDVLVGALGVTSAVLPYLGQLTHLFSSDDPKPANPTEEVVLAADQVSRLQRDVIQDLEQEIISDSFLGLIASPFTIAWETATIIFDVLDLTNRQGLTQFEVPESLVRSKRSIFDFFDRDTPDNVISKYGPDLTSITLSLPDQVSNLN